MLPSALIPFCIYQSDNTAFGQTIKGTNMTACSDFKPIVLDGQLCYSLNLAKSGTKKTKSGKSNGLFLVIDPNSLQMEYKEKNPFRIFINTLSPHTLGGPGIYALSALKKMTGTQNFLDLPEHKKDCRVGSTEECLAETLIAEIKSQCHCVPWQLAKKSTNKVISDF